MKTVQLLFMLGLIFSRSVSALESTTEVKGYVDAQAQWGRGQLELQPNSFYGGQPGFGFAVHKGAFEFLHRSSKTQMHIDIPFHQTRTSPDNNNNLDLAKERAQAYITGTPNEQWSWMLGQFDTPWGYEGNDTNTIMYRNLGIIYNVTPNTNTGFYLTRHYTPFTKVALFVGNSNQFSKQKIDRKLEQGVRLSMQMGPHFFHLGVLFNQRKGKYSLTGNSYEYQQGALVDLQLGHRVIDRMIVLNAIYIHPDNEKSLHNGIVADTNPTYGLMLDIPLYKDQVRQWGLRAEHLWNDRSNEFVQSVSASGNGSILTKVSLGNQRLVDEAFSIKTTLDYFMVNVGENGKDNRWVEGAIAGIYQF